MGSRRKARILAFQALYGWELTRYSPEEVSRFPFMEEEKLATLGEETLAFARILTAGTIENLDRIDEVIRSHLENWDFDRLSRVDLALIRMSLYSLLFQPSVPATVVIDEAIDIAREFGSDDSYRFVNGLLDSARKSIGAQNAAAAAAAAPPTARLTVKARKRPKATPRPAD